MLGALLLLLPGPVLLSGATELDLVADVAGVLSEEEFQTLNDIAQGIASAYPCEVAVLVVDELDGATATSFAKAVYERYDYGHGEKKSGALLLLSIQERDCALIAHGYGNDVFTDYGKDALLDRTVLPLLSKDSYYAAFLAYLGKAEEYLEMASSGTPFDAGTDPARRGERAQSSLFGKLAVTILVPMAIAGVVCLVFLRQMKTAVAQQAADNYIPEDGFALTAQEDAFLFRTETRRRIEKAKQGGTTTDRSGYSSKERKF